MFLFSEFHIILDKYVLRNLSFLKKWLNNKRIFVNNFNLTF